MVDQRIEAGSAPGRAHRTRCLQSRRRCCRAERLAADERQQIRVKDIGIDGEHAVREARIKLQLCPRHQLGLERGGVAIGNDLVIVALQDQRGNGDRLQVGGLIGFRKGPDALILGVSTCA